MVAREKLLLNYYQQQGRIQELKGGGADVHTRKFHADFGVLRGMPNWEGES